MIRVVAALLLSCQLVCLARAGEAKVGGTSLNLMPPPGYCELDAAKATDARAVAAIAASLSRTGNRLLALSADCGELRDWRAGTRPIPDHMAQYRALTNAEDAALSKAPQALLKDSCTLMRVQGGQPVDLDIKARAEQTVTIIKNSETRFMGVVAEDAQGCYAALLQKFTAESGDEKIRAILFATVVLRDKVIIHYYLLAPYISSDTVVQMLATQRANVAKLQAANP
jgi:hypothetical protein